jgi:hypothetical protein
LATAFEAAALLFELPLKFYAWLPLRVAVRLRRAVTYRKEQPRIFSRPREIRIPAVARRDKVNPI